jgi:hypothetical protein
MPRVLIATNIIAPNLALDTLTWTPANATDNHYYVAEHDVILVVRNLDAAPKTVTILSVAEPRYGRTGDKAITVGADGAVVFFGVASPEAWRQPNSANVHVNVSAATNLAIAALRVRRLP